MVHLKERICLFCCVWESRNESESKTFFRVGFKLFGVVSWSSEVEMETHPLFLLIVTGQGSCALVGRGSRTWTLPALECLPQVQSHPWGRGVCGVGWPGFLATAQLNRSTVADIIQESLTTTPETSSRRHSGSPSSSSPSANQQQPADDCCCWPRVAPHPRMSLSTPSPSCWEWGVNKTMCGLMMEWFEGCVLRTASLFTGRINQNYGL